MERIYHMRDGEAEIGVLFDPSRMPSDLLLGLDKLYKEGEYAYEIRNVNGGIEICRTREKQTQTNARNCG